MTHFCIFVWICVSYLKYSISIFKIFFFFKHFYRETFSQSLFAFQFLIQVQTSFPLGIFGWNFLRNAFRILVFDCLWAYSNTQIPFNADECHVFTLGEKKKSSTRVFTHHIHIEIFQMSIGYVIRLKWWCDLKNLDHLLY